MVTGFVNIYLEGGEHSCVHVEGGGVNIHMFMFTELENNKAEHKFMNIYLTSHPKYMH